MGIEPASPTLTGGFFTTESPGKPTNGHIPLKNHNSKNTCTPKFIAFITAKTWKQSRCPLTDEWIKKWYIYTREYYSAMKRNGFESVELRADKT